MYNYNEQRIVTATSTGLSLQWSLRHFTYIHFQIITIIVVPMPIFATVPNTEAIC